MLLEHRAQQVALLTLTSILPSQEFKALPFRAITAFARCRHQQNLLRSYRYIFKELDRISIPRE